MRRSTTIHLTVLAASVLALAGCTPPGSPAASGPLNPTLQVLPTATPTPTAETPADTAATSDVVVAAYSLGETTSTNDSGYRHANGTADAFPAGSPVLSVRIELSGYVPKGQPDFTGLSLQNSSFTGTSDLAVLDETDGKSIAAAHHLPFGPKPADTPWLLENDATDSFVASWHVPASTPSIVINVAIPSQTVPLTLTVPVSTEH